MSYNSEKTLRVEKYNEDTEEWEEFDSKSTDANYHGGTETTPIAGEPLDEIGASFRLVEVGTPTGDVVLSEDANVSLSADGAVTIEFDEISDTEGSKESVIIKLRPTGEYNHSEAPVEAVNITADFNTSDEYIVRVKDPVTGGWVEIARTDESRSSLSTTDLSTVFSNGAEGWDRGDLEFHVLNITTGKITRSSDSGSVQVTHDPDGSTRIEINGGELDSGTNHVVLTLENDYNAVTRTNDPINDSLGTASTNVQVQPTPPYDLEDIQKLKEEASVLFLEKLAAAPVPSKAATLHNLYKALQIGRSDEFKADTDLVQISADIQTLLGDPEI